MNAALAILRLDLRHVARDRSSILWMLAMPFAFMAFFGNVFRAPDPEPRNRRIAIGVDDSDRTELSRALAASFDTTRYRIVDVAAEVAAGDTTGDEAPVRTLVIPEGLERAVFAGEPVDVTLRRDGGDSEYLLAAQAGVVRALVRVHGALAVAAPESAWTDATLATFRERVERPPPILVSSTWAGQARVPGGYGQSVPGNLVTFLLMSTVIQSATLLTAERTGGTLRRIASQPVARSTYFLGTFLARLTLALVQFVLLVAGAHALFGFRIMGSLLGFAAVGVTFCGTCVALGLWLGTRFETVKQAAMTAWIGALLMAAIGGAWWPLKLVPRWMRTFAHAFPTAWAMDGFHAVTSYAGGFDAVLAPLAVLLAVTLGFFTLSVRAFRPE